MPAETDAPPQELSLDEAMRYALQLHQQGQREVAEQIYQRILEVAPQHADALHYLGVAQHQAGHTDKAIDLIKEAVRHAPDYADAFNNLGNIQKEAGRPEAAETAFRRVLELRPGDTGAMNNLGVALKKQRRLDEAEQVLREALAADPDSRDINFNLGNVYRHQKRHDLAMQFLERAIELDPRKADGYQMMGQIFYCLNQPERALQAYRRWLDADPDSVTAKHFIAACSGEDVPERGADAFVKEIFDDFAASFDRKLRDNLQYRAPELLHEALAAQLGERAGRGELDILDAGCGTGLCGALLRPHGRRLEGVDLSPKMLDRARALDCYDDLAEDELTAAIARRTDELDAIFSADTLCYFGALEKVACVAAAALREGGLLAFTVEALPEDAPGDRGYRLLPSGRYSHRRSYLQRVLQDAGLSVAHLADAVLRQENSQPVHGHVVVARKPRT